MFVDTADSGGGCQPGIAFFIYNPPGNGNNDFVSEGNCNGATGTAVQTSSGSANATITGGSCCGGGTVAPGPYAIFVAVTAGQASAGVIRLELSPGISILNSTTGHSVFAYDEYDFAKATGGTFVSTPAGEQASIHGSIPVSAQNHLLAFYTDQHQNTTNAIQYTDPNGTVFSGYPAYFIGDQVVDGGGPGTYSFRLDEDLNIVGTTYTGSVSVQGMDVVFP